MRAALLTTALLALACSSEDSFELFVDLKTDYIAQDEFTRVDTLLVLNDANLRDQIRLDLEGGEDFDAGARIAEITAVPEGTHRLIVRLYADDGIPFDQTEVVLDVRRNLAITVLMTRRCRDVTCPGAGDPDNFTRCLDGLCVDERCSEIAPEYCPSTCEMASDCPAGVECTTASCERGFCFGRPDDAMCHVSERCDPIEGCGLDPGFIGDEPVICGSWETSFFDACALPAPMGDLVLDEPGTYVYDTDDGTLTSPSMLDVPQASAVIDGVRVVSVERGYIEEGTQLRVEGNLPFLLAASVTIEVRGEIDVSSGAVGRGAGANGPDCTGAGRGGNGEDSAGGGGGGGFGGDGGAGGPGTDRPLWGGGGSGGSVLPVPTTVRGGCGGAGGGRGNPDPMRGPGGGGRSGGAAQLVAGRAILVRGLLHAGGSGGGGGGRSDASNDHAGGGGGSGGLIGLDSAFVYVDDTAVLAANGGGGGAGSASQTRGADATPGTVPAMGGDGRFGGAGGDGAAAATTNGADGFGGGEGGGGGGGGAGYILLRATVANVRAAATFSPAYTEL